MIQQDPRRNRYAQQQRVDLQRYVQKNPPISRFKLVQNRKSGHSRTSNMEENSFSNREINFNKTALEEALWGKLLTNKPRISRKILKPSVYNQSNEVVEDVDDINRQDDQQNNVVFVNPDFTKYKIENIDNPQEHLSALKALVGKNPDTQLEGLKKLLEAPHSGYLAPPCKDEFKDHTSSATSLHYFQDQIEVDSRLQHEEILDQIQREASDQAKTQYKAISRALANAEKNVEQNNEDRNGRLINPLVGQLMGEVVDYSGQNYNNFDQPEIQKIPRGYYRAQQDPNLRKISITKSHSITKGSVPRYEGMVFQSQHEELPIFREDQPIVFVRQAKNVRKNVVQEQEYDVSGFRKVIPCRFCKEKLKTNTNVQITFPKIHKISKRETNNSSDFEVDYEYDQDSKEPNQQDNNNTGLVIEFENLDKIETQALKRRKRKRNRKRNKPKHVRYHNHKPIYKKIHPNHRYPLVHDYSENVYPLYPLIVPTPIKDTQGLNSGGNDPKNILSTLNKHEPSNVIVINNSNDQHNQGPYNYNNNLPNNHYPQGHVRVKKRPKIVVNVRPKGPNVKKYRQINHKIAFVVKKLSQNNRH